MEDFFKILFLCVVVFLGAYFIVFYMAKIPQKEITISIVTTKDLKAISKNEKQMKELERIVNELKEYKVGLEENKNENYLTVSTLNAFYSSLFTAIAVIAGIIGLIGWKTLKELKEKLDTFKNVEDKVNFLHRMKDDIQWAKEKIDGKELKITSSKLKLNKDEKDRVDEIKENLLEENSGRGWLEIIIAKNFYYNKEKNKVFRIYDGISRKTLLDQELEAVLYHLIGQVYFDYYLQEKEDKDIQINDTMKDIKDEFVEEEITVKDIINTSINYYKKSLNIRKENKLPFDETLGNLSVVLIELARLKNKSKQDANEEIEDAIKYLNKIIEEKKETFNTYYDFARAYYLCNEIKRKGCEEILSKKIRKIISQAVEYDKKIKKILEKAINMTDSINEEKIFFEYLEEDDILDSKIRKELVEFKLRNKKYLCEKEET